MKRFEVSRVWAAAALVAAASFALVTALPARAAISFGDVTPQKATGNPDFIPGTGIPRGMFTIDTAGTGEKVALKARDRATGVPVAQVLNRYFVSAGNDPGNPARAAWNFDFQFTPIPGKVATDYTYEVQADIDPLFGIANFVTIAVPPSVQAVPMGDSFYPNGTGGSISPGPVYSYNGPWTDATIPFIIGNSQNYKFAHLAGSGFANGDPGEYEIRFTARDAVGGGDVASVTIFAIVPEPGSAALLAVSAVGFLGARRRCRRAC
jgi:hypothetical protein